MSALQSRARPTGSDARESPTNGALAGKAKEQPSALSLVVQERRLRKVLERIESEPSCSVRELALEVHLSPGHLQRLFKQETGVHVSDLIVEQRLHRAAALLSASDMPIKEIAFAVGYQHHSSFVRAFHSRFGESPKHYRKRSVE